MFDFCFAVEFGLFVSAQSVAGTRIKIRLHLSYDGDGDGDYASSEADNPLRILGY